MYSLNLLNFVFVVVFDVFRRRGVVAITAAQLHSTKPELGFCAGSNPARGVLKIRHVEDLWQIVRAWNKTKRLSSVNQTRKTIHHQFIQTALENAKFAILDQ